MKGLLHRRLQRLEGRAREEDADASPPGYWAGLLMERLTHIHERTPPELRLEYASQSNVEEVKARLKALLDSPKYRDLH
jgi:hypothetical protein